VQSLETDTYVTISVKVCTALHGNPSQSHGVCHMESHSVTCHQTHAQT